MKISELKTYKLRNEEHFRFMSEVKILVESTGAKYLDVEDTFREFVSFYDKENNLLKQEARTSCGKKVEESDTRRDDYHRGIELIIKGNLRHSKPEIREAAKALKVILDRFGDLRPLPYEQETETIIKFCNDMEKQKRFLDILHLSEWIEMLKAENNTFQKYFNQFEQDFEGSDTSLKCVRRMLDQLYDDLMLRIEALSMVKGDWKYIDFVNRLNRTIEKIAKPVTNTQDSYPSIPERYRPETFY